MELPDYISIQEVQRICKQLEIRDWTKLEKPEVNLKEAELIAKLVGSEALQVSTENFRRGLEIELEHGLEFPDANVTNNHPILTGKIVLAHLKEMLDYYTRLEVAEIEGDMLKASRIGDEKKLAAYYKKLLAAKAELVQTEQSSRQAK
jgi:hypothetical protein